MKKLLVSMILLLCLCNTSFALDENLPDSATLSANRMRYDAQTGDFVADGNVTIKAGDLRVNAPESSGNIDRKEIHFDRGITASGRWMGDKISLKAGRMVLSFANVPTCKFQGGVKGGFGTMNLDADNLTITGAGGLSTPRAGDRQTKFWLNTVRKLEDTARGLSFGANSVEGIVRGGRLYDMTAKKNVWLNGKQKGQADPVSIKGNNALYSLERGSVVLSGHVVAVQGGRTLKSDSVVYFPEQNRVEALGGLTRKGKGGAVSADRAEITIDLARERKQDSESQPKQKTLQIPTTNKNTKTQPKAQPKKRTSTSTRRTRKR